MAGCLANERGAHGLAGLQPCLALVAVGDEGALGFAHCFEGAGVAGGLALGEQPFAACGGGGREAVAVDEVFDGEAAVVLGGRWGQ